MGKSYACTCRRISVIFSILSAGGFYSRLQEAANDRWTSLDLERDVANDRRVCPRCGLPPKQAA